MVTREYIPMLTEEELSVLATGTATPALQAKAASEISRKRTEILKMDEHWAADREGFATLYTAARDAVAHYDHYGNLDKFDELRRIL
jgi:hypothetical protein